MDVEAEMRSIKSKKLPNAAELQKYVRYLVNVRKYDEESVYKDVPQWNKTDVARALKEVERENMRPKPKRYYVSLKEPLEEER